MHICGEIQYDSAEGPVHSDICLNRDGEDFSANVDNLGGTGTSWRTFLHDNLDEWLDKSNGTGWFIVGSIPLDI
jgi:hypothetical protein